MYSTARTCAAPAPHRAPSAQGTAIAVQRRHADQLGDLAPAQPTEFRQFGEQGRAG